MNANVVIRPFQPAEDTNFILSSWLRSYRLSSQFAHRITDAIFYHYHQLIVQRILTRSKILIACLPDDPSVIIGYLVYEQYAEQPLIQYAYVKKPFRNEGVLTSLIEAAEIDLEQPAQFSHMTEASEAIARHFPKLTYNPYLI
jgi:hypothetical protein